MVAQLAGDFLCAQTEGLTVMKAAPGMWLALPHKNRAGSNEGGQSQ
jgi:hypothetical protein